MGEGSQLSGREINRMLASHLDSLVPLCLPGAVLAGGFWQCGSVRGEPGDSLKLHARGPKAGQWADYACSRTDPEGTGDLIKLVTLTLGNGDIRQGFAEAKRFLALDTMDPRKLEAVRERAAKAEARAKREKARGDEGKRRNAERMFMRAIELTPSSPPVKYLESRGIDFGHLKKLPRCLRYHPKVPHGEAQRELPAMATRVQDLAGRHVGTHFTFLELGRDGWRKLGPIEVADPKTGEVAPMSCAKKIWGPTYYGGHVPLWKGAHRAPLADLPGAVEVNCSEGIEDGLSWAMADPTARVVCAGTLGNIGAMALPPQLQRFTILAQRDDKAKAQEALETAVRTQQERAREAGRSLTVGLRWPPEGINDWNDWLRSEAL